MRKIIFVFLLLISSAYSIEKLKGQWTLGSSAGFPYFVDADFYGTWEEFDQTQNTDDPILPIGDNNIGFLNIAFDLNYRFFESNWSIFVDYNFAALTSSRSTYPLFGASRVTISALQTTFGTAYNWGDGEDNWNYYVKAGFMNGVYGLVGTNESLDQSESRINVGFGIGLEPGIACNFCKLPISIDFKVRANVPFTFISGEDLATFDNKNFLLVNPQFGIKLWM